MKQKERKPLSLYPLRFDDALVALAKTKPLPKAKAKTKKPNRPAKTK